MPAHPPSTEALFERYRQRGDANDLAAVFDRTAPALLAVARRLVRSRSDAEDLVQSTFVTAIERANAFDASRALVPWLIGILAGHAKNGARAAARARPSGSVEVIERESVLDSLIALEERSAVATALNELPEPYRSVVANRLHDISSVDSGAPSKGTLRVQLHRALTRMRRLLPASLLGGALAATLDRRAIARLRTRMLSRGSRTAATIPLIPFEGMLMWKKLAVVAVVLAACAWIAIERWKSDAPKTRLTTRDVDAPSIATPSVSDEPTPATRDLVVDAGKSATPPPAAPPSARITGRVIDSATGAPIAGAACFVTSDNPREYEPPPAAVRSDSAGRFAIENVGHRPTLARVIAAEFAPLRQRIEWPGDTVAQRDGVELGDLRLSRGGTVRGHVIDAEGRPVEGASLLLYEQPPSTSMFFPSWARPVGKTRTDGSFTLEQVPPSGSFQWMLFAITAKGSAATQLNVLGGRDSTLDVELRLARSGHLEIEVVDEAGKPVEGATVGAAPIAEPYVLGDWSSPGHPRGKSFAGRHIGCTTYPFFPPALRVTSDAAGHAAIDALPAALPCTVHVMKEDHVAWFADVVNLSAVGPTKLRATLQLPRFFALTGRVVDPAGNPVRGVAVERYGHYQCDVTPKIDETPVDGAGRFRFEHVEAATELDLCIGAPGIARRPFHVEIPIDRDLVDLVLVATPSAPIAGIVVDDAGDPISDAFVSAQQTDTYVPSDRLFSDAAGRFEISNATAGRWKVSAGIPGPTAAWRDRNVVLDVAAGDQNVRLVGVRASLRRAEVSIEVVDAGSQQPLEPAKAHYGPRPKPPSFLGGGFGADQRERGLVRLSKCKPGEWRLAVKCAGRATAYLDFDVAPTDTSLRLRLAIPRPARVTGRITAIGLSPAELRVALKDATIEGAPGSGIAYANPDEFVPPMIALNGSSEFRFEQVASGICYLVLDGKELVGSVRLDAKADADNVIELQASRPGTVKTLGAAAFPTSYVLLRLIPMDGAEAWLTLGSPGQETHEGSRRLAAGTWNWKLLFTPADAPPQRNKNGMQAFAEGTIEVRAGETTEIALPAPPK